MKDGEFKIIKKPTGEKIIIHYSGKRAKKDAHNRQKGLKRLEKRIHSGKLTKSSINNRGYNKYLKLEGEIEIGIDYEKFERDEVWDGLKGYVTNTKLRAKQVIENYQNLWHIEKAFRMSKTDLRIRPIYHRLKDRIEAHICISFAAYAIYKELERLLHNYNAPFSVKRAGELTQTMYQLDVILPESKKKEQILLKMDSDQLLLTKIIAENF